MMCSWPAPTATPTIGVLVREHKAAGGIQISASHNPPTYNGLKFFQRAGMVLEPGSKGPLSSTDGSVAIFAGRAGNRSAGLAGSTIPIKATWSACSRSSTPPRSAQRDSRSCSTPATAPADGWGRPCSRPWDAGPIVLGGQPDGRYDHLPEPTEANLKEFSAVVPAVGAAVGFAQDPDADRLAIVDETGRYIGEELTLALAASRRLQQAKGPIVLNLSTSRVTEELARRLGCPVFRTPVGEINVVERMIAENALLGRRGKRRGDRSAGRLRSRQFRGDGDGPRPDGGDGRAAFASGRRIAALCDDQGPVSPGAEPQQTGRPRRGPSVVAGSGTGSRRLAPTRVPTGVTGCGSTGTTVGCTFGPAIPSRSCG